MRYDKSHKEKTRARIVTNASMRFRRDGIAAVGLRMLVADAGLTHGAFYAHFPSRSDLIAESIGSALEDTCGYFERKVSEMPPSERFRCFVETYLDMDHRNGTDIGCAGAALAPEVAREGSEARRFFMAGVDRLASLVVEALPPGGTEHQRKARARTIFAGMMGVLQVSRTADDAEAGEILKDGRAAALTVGLSPWPPER